MLDISQHLKKTNEALLNIIETIDMDYLWI